MGHDNVLKYSALEREQEKGKGRKADKFDCAGSVRFLKKLEFLSEARGARKDIRYPVKYTDGDAVAAVAMR